nr:hypothetical protein [Tanacetum cinerariifolium]
MGYGVHSDEVEIAARNIGCATFVAPFSHLKVKVGGRMERINSWDDVVSKMRSWLSKWKLKTLSIGEPLKLYMERKEILELMVTLLDALLGLISFERSVSFVPKKVLRWWDLDENMIDSYDDWLLLLKNIRLPKRLKDLFEGLCYVKWWLIWRIRNQVLLGDKHPPRDTLFDDLVTIYFQWCSNRCNSKLNRDTVTDVEKLNLRHEETHGFSRMLESLDCTDWEWFDCPYSFKAQYVRRNHGPNPFILLEVVASQDLWIWHAFFGVVGSNNDINVLFQSPLFNDLKTRRALKIPFVANSVTFPSGYYLADGIYLELAPLVKTIPEPADDNHKRILYKQKQESARKDVERAFGVLKKKWSILANPIRALKKRGLLI